RSITRDGETYTESGTIGFSLKRRGKDSPEPAAVNPELLPAVLNPRGGRYVYVDTAAQPGVSYEYELVEVQASGQETSLGRFPVNTARAAVPRARPLDPGAEGYARVAHTRPAGSARRGGAGRAGARGCRRPPAGHAR